MPGMYYNTSMRVAFYQSSPQHLYGGQIDLLRYFQALDRSSIAPYVLVPGPGPFAQRVRALGLPLITLPLPPELAQTGGALLRGSLVDRLRQAALLLPWNLRLARRLRGLGVQVLYANNRRAVLTVGMAARMAGIPLFWHIKQANAGRGWMDSAAMALCTYAAGCSTDVAAAFRRQHPRRAARIGVVPNGIPLDVFAVPGPGMRNQLGIAPEAVLIGQIGSLTPRKGVDLFVEAALRLAAQFDGLHFVLAGEAPSAYATYKQACLRRVQSLQAAGRFHTPGWVDDVPNLLHSLDVLVLPSRMEGFGLIVAEAAAAGVPVVRTASGGHDETTIDGETGFIVPVDDLDALVARLHQLICDADLRQRMGQAARRHARAHLGLDRFVDALSTALEHTAQLS